MKTKIGDFVSISHSNGVIYLCRHSLEVIIIIILRVIYIAPKNVKQTVYLLRQLMAVSQETGRQHWVIWCYLDHVRRHMVRVPSVCLGPQVEIISHLVLRT